MRDLINILDNIVLSESRGLGARRPGEVFKSTTGQGQIYFDSATFYPPGGGKMDPATLKDTYQQVVADLGVTPTEVNSPDARTGAFGIATFRDDAGNILAFTRWYQEAKADPATNTWDNQKGIPGYKYASKAAEKTQAGMTPQDILTQQSDLEPDDIIRQIAEKFGMSSPLVQAAQAVSAGENFPIEIAAEPSVGFTAFRDYFCELLHPIAMLRGNYSGNAKTAAQKFLNQDSFAGMRINFGKDKNEGLSDSVLINADGRKIKLSSKGATGATASTKNLVDSVNELRDAVPQMVTKHKDTISLIEDVIKHGQSGAPLLLGVRFGIITQEDAFDIQTFKKLPPTTMAAVADMDLGAKLKKLVMKRVTKNPDNVNLYFHSIAAVAHQVADYVNENTNFSSAASEILNNGALVQVYTKAKEVGGKWVLQGFDTVYPGSAVTGVKFSASKTYSSTAIKGNFTFKILRNGATDVDEPEDDEIGTERSKPIAAPSAVTGKRLHIRPPGVDDTLAVAKPKGVGRSLRK